MCWRLTGWALDWALESAHCSVVSHKPLNSCRTLSCLNMVLLWIRFFKVIHLQREYISHFWKHSLLSSNIYLHTNLLHTKVKCHVFFTVSAPAVCGFYVGACITSNYIQVRFVYLEHFLCWYCVVSWFARAHRFAVPYMSGVFFKGQDGIRIHRLTKLFTRFPQGILHSHLHAHNCQTTLTCVLSSTIATAFI